MISGTVIDYKLFLNNQEDIFQKAFGFYPELGKFYTSPFRDGDNYPGCRFEWRDEMLFFVDNAGFNGKIFFTCFDAFCIINMVSFRRALNMLASNKINIIKRKPKFRVKQNSDINIKFKYKPFTDENYFTNLGITKEQLNNDEEVFLVSEYWANSKVNASLIKNKFGILPNKLIAYYFKETDHVKLYFTYKDKFRWYTNCNIQDVFFWYNIKNYPKDVLIITKSKKDAMVLWYVYKIPSIALMNEVCDIPEEKLNMIKTFDKIYFLYDNDETGIYQSKRKAAYYGFKSLHYEQGNDTAQLQLENPNYLKTFLNGLNLLK